MRQTLGTEQSIQGGDAKHPTEDYNCHEFMCMQFSSSWTILSPGNHYKIHMLLNILSPCACVATTLIYAYSKFREHLESLPVVYLGSVLLLL